MDPTLTQEMLRLHAISIGLAVVGILSPFVGFWVLMRQLRYAQESLERITAMIRGDHRP